MNLCKKHVLSCIPYHGQFYVLFHAGYPTYLIYKGAWAYSDRHHVPWP